jgi:tetratricopeptide (TPR) repeat protein
MAIAEQEYQEALQIRRELAVENPRSFLYYVATTLNNLAVLHKNKNERLIAEQEYQEALEIYQELAVENPRSFLPDVAQTLNNLAILQKNTNEMPIAEQKYQEALQIYQELAVENPRSFLPYVATTLLNLSIFYLQAQPDPEKSFALAQEVIEIAQQFPYLPSVQHYAEQARAVLQAISE